MTRLIWSLRVVYKPNARQLATITTSSQMSRPVCSSQPHGTTQQGHEKIALSHSETQAVNFLPEAFYTTVFSEAAMTRVSDPSKSSLSPRYPWRVQNRRSSSPFIHRLQVRDVLHFEHFPGVISLLAGKPNSSTFPITSLQFTARDPADPTSEIAIELSPEELSVALQYSLTPGLTSLCEWFYGLQEISHGRKKSDEWKLSIGAGSQDFIYKVLISGSPPELVGHYLVLLVRLYPLWSTQGTLC